MWLLWALLGCWDPTSTGAGGIAGKLVDDAGIPLANLRVDSLEHGDKTSADGSFSVTWKEPSTYVDFTHLGVRYQRKWVPEKDQGVVEVKLPVTKDLTLRCELAEPCSARVHWDLGGGLTAEGISACKPGMRVHIVGAPAFAPKEARCLAEDGQPLAAIVETPDIHTVIFANPAKPLRVEVRHGDDAAPRSCAVRIGGADARSEGDAYVGDARGVVLVEALCDGRPALPQNVDVDQHDAVSLDWSPVGPVLDLAGRGPVGAELTLLPASGAWALRVLPGDKGTYALPPLTAGTWRFAVGPVDPLLVAEAKTEAKRAGTVGFNAVPNVTGQWLGLLKLEQDLDGGAIPVEGL